MIGAFNSTPFLLKSVIQCLNGIKLARKKRTKKVFGFKGHVYAFDSTTIDRCLELFEWAKFRSTKGGVKLNDVKIQIHVAIITYCLVAIVHHDMKLNRSLYEILQILEIPLIDKTPLQELLTAKNPEKQEKVEDGSLDLFNDLFLC